MDPLFQELNLTGEEAEVNFGRTEDEEDLHYCLKRRFDLK